MKNVFKILFVLFISSCSNSTQESSPATLVEEELALKPDTLLAKKSTADSSQKVADTSTDENESGECVFDQTTQTDEFLQNIKELNGYKWDYEKRTATFVLETGDTLLISRGGCNHFAVSAEFRLRNDKTDYTKWSNVYKKVLWIAKALDKEFDFQELKNDIEANKVTIEKYDHADIASFSSEILVDRDYSIVRELGPEVKVITLSYSIV
ncbi:hypothetical protein [Rufibacter quisquiliarum]|uniref:Uncharacterized protein n=1 Tax=Rufibacter quisquiliarum TaxID=1549639 RepID=A0A839GJL7_9BACT|nr:hypothetical protein [Rufibacter quisquiliarum]MBA9077933.1 hypothetical protein [Rufibacter quisquiliarum]